MYEINEIWKDVKGTDGEYQVSNLGRVKSLKFGKETILRQLKNSNGYFHVALSIKGKRKQVTVHRLVAEAFISGKSNLQVNHKDENKTNNCVNNLEFVTPSQNINHGTRNKRMIKKISTPIIQLLNGVEVNSFKSLNEAERELGFARSHISQCCNGTRNSAYGYQWKFK